MNCVPDLGKLLFVGGVAAGGAGILKLFQIVDTQLQEYCDKSLWNNWFWYTGIISMPLVFVGQHSFGWGWMSLFVLGIYLLVCTVTDTLLCQVYDMMQYLGVFGGIIWLLTQKPEPRIGYSLIFFALLQYIVLIHMYGKADGMGYCICSLYLAGAGMDIEGYLYHMIISFCLLAVVQGFRGNISRKGNLKRPVPLYPYICVGFITMWIFLF